VMTILLWGFSILPGTVTNQMYYQRIFAAKNVREGRQGIYIAAAGINPRRLLCARHRPSSPSNEWLARNQRPRTSRRFVPRRNPIVVVGTLRFILNGHHCLHHWFRFAVGCCEHGPRLAECIC